jgi:hypothetical protein
LDNRDPTKEIAFCRSVRGIISGMYFCRPGFVEKFDAATQLAEVTPAIMMKYSVDGKVEYRKLPKLENVPVVIPFVQTLGLALTLPIKPGDECLLVFCDRGMDDFLEKGAQQGNAKPEACGGENKTTEPRMHHLADAICIPGIISLPQVLPAWSTEAIELRNRDRTAYISLNANTNIAIQTTGNIAIQAGGTIDVTAGGEIGIQAGGDLVEKGANIRLN